MSLAEASARTNPSGPRTQRMGLQGPNTINSIVFGPETLSIGSYIPRYSPHIIPL